MAGKASTSLSISASAAAEWSSPLAATSITRAPFSAGDLVSSGNTLKANDLVAVEEILPISARLIVNPASLKLKRDAVQPLLEAIAGAAVPMEKVDG